MEDQDREILEVLVTNSANEESSEESVNQELTPEQELDQELLQNRIPIKNDIIDVFDFDTNYWYTVKLTSNVIKYYPYYYNCIFPDNSRGGVYLRPGELWTFHIDIEYDEESQDEVAQEDLEVEDLPFHNQ